MSQPTRYLKADYVAEMLQLTRTQSYELIKKMPPGVAVYLGKRVRVNEAAFLDWLAKGGSKAASA